MTAPPPRPPAFADGLRALADLIDAHPDVKRPYVGLACATTIEYDAWHDATIAAGLTVEDRANRAGTMLSVELPGLTLRISYAYAESMRRYSFEQDLLSANAADDRRANATSSAV